MATTARTTTPAMFHAKVAYSRANPDAAALCARCCPRRSRTVPAHHVAGYFAPPCELLAAQSWVLGGRTGLRAERPNAVSDVRAYLQGPEEAKFDLRVIAQSRIEANL
jgi:hypothetical protein